MVEEKVIEKKPVVADKVVKVVKIDKIDKVDKVNKTVSNPSSSSSSGKELVAVLIRGLHDIDVNILKALDTLRFRNKHVCVILQDTVINRGQLQKVKDYVAYGELDAETKKVLVDKRGEKDSKGVLKPFFRLHPPKGGYPRKGIKVPYSSGGSIGYWGKDINKLIVKML